MRALVWSTTAAPSIHCAVGARASHSSAFATPGRAPRRCRGKRGQTLSAGRDCREGTPILAAHTSADGGPGVTLVSNCVQRHAGTVTNSIKKRRRGERGRRIDDVDLEEVHALTFLRCNCNVDREVARSTLSRAGCFLQRSCYRPPHPPLLFFCVRGTRKAAPGLLTSAHPFPSAACSPPAEIASVVPGRLSSHHSICG